MPIQKWRLTIILIVISDEPHPNRCRRFPWRMSLESTTERYTEQSPSGARTRKARAEALSRLFIYLFLGTGRGPREDRARVKGPTSESWAQQGVRAYMYEREAGNAIAHGLRI